MSDRIINRIINPGAGQWTRQLSLPAALLALLLLAGAPSGFARTGEDNTGQQTPGEPPAIVEVAAVQDRASQAALLPGNSAEAGAQVLWNALGATMALSLLAWTLLRKRGINNIDSPGFEIITTSEIRKFIPLEEKFQQMDYLAKVETRGALRLSANLNKVSLSFRRNGYLLEDKNFRNALLVNRRRVRRTLLRDGDVLDLGDLTLLYRDNRGVPIIRHSAVTPPDGKVQIKFERVRGPVRKGTPMLVADQASNRIFYLTKNLVFLGRSENNDLIIKSKGVSYRHAKIERVGSRYKLLDLSGTGNTFVNNRRVEQRMLRDGDEIAVDNQRFKFQLVSKPIRETTYAKPPSQERVGAGAEEGAEAGSEAGSENSAQLEETSQGGEGNQPERQEGSEANA